MAFGMNKKVAQQGSMGKAPMQPVKKSGTPSGVKKPAADKIMFSNQPSGTRGGSAPKHASN
jgi:hypothetical protein